MSTDGSAPLDSIAWLLTAVTRAAQDSQLTSVRAENNALRSELASERKRLADMEGVLHSRAAAARGSGPASSGMAGGFMSNKKVGLGLRASCRTRMWV